MFSITKNCFEIIGDILLQILDEVLIDKDYESARYCIILSQTYHFMNDHEKVSLQQKIEKHDLLKMTDFWENFIAYSIFEEIEKQNDSVSNANESEEEKNNRISNIVFSQLLPITDNMLCFEISKEKIKEIICGFAKQYSIPFDLNQHLISMVDDFVYTYPIEFNTQIYEKVVLEPLINEGFLLPQITQAVVLEDPQVSAENKDQSLGAKENEEVVSTVNTKSVIEDVEPPLNYLDIEDIESVESKVISHEHENSKITPVIKKSKENIMIQDEQENINYHSPPNTPVQEQTQKEMMGSTEVFENIKSKVIFALNEDYIE